MFGKSEEEKQKEQREREEKSQLVEKLRKIIVFPGDDRMFKDFFGYEVKGVDLGEKNKGLIYDYSASMTNPFHHYSLELQKEIVNKGVIALINSNLGISDTDMSFERIRFYGLPVKKKD